MFPDYDYDYDDNDYDDGLYRKMLQCSFIVRGLFKKRPNFLNSAPTSTESALRLLSAPSVRF
jgi:hypothetical protein